VQIRWRHEIYSLYNKFYEQDGNQNYKTKSKFFKKYNFGITINVPLIFKMQDIFCEDKIHIGPFQEIFQGGQIFFIPKLSWAIKKLGTSRNIWRNAPLCSLSKTIKNNILHFQNQPYIDIFMSLCNLLPLIWLLYCF
jgi:hypothetical protein